MSERPAQWNHDYPMWRNVAPASYPLPRLEDVPSPEDQAREAAIRAVAWHDGRDYAARAVLGWCRENWPVIAEAQRVDPAIWNSMPETLAKVAKGEGLGAAVTGAMARCSEAPKSRPRWPDYEGCANQAEHDDHINDLREAWVASLTLRQRIARHWAWYWEAWAVSGVICLGLAVVVLFVWRAVPS